jgi:glycosyltransferase involved in cell wall biosynthesis
LSAPGIATTVGRHRRDALPTRALSRLAGTRILLLNWRDVTHPDAGGAETYIHEIGRRWVAAGAAVTMLTARPAGAAATTTVDGIDIRRAGGTFSVYLRTAARLLTGGHQFDVVVDCQNGIPFFAPLFTPTPAVHLVHHVHQDQFTMRFHAAFAALGRLLESRVSRRVYARRRTVAVSASTRQEIRSRLGFDGIIDVVPNGLTPQAEPTSIERGPARAGLPTVVVVSRLVPHKRLEVLLRAVAAARVQVPALRVEIVGDGTELDALRREAAALDLGATVTFHGRLSTEQRDALVRTAWLTASTSASEGWGQTVLEAAAAGVPCVALRVPGIRDSVVDGRTGWLADDPGGFAAALVSAVAELSRPGVAARVAAECRRWAACFDWDRSAELLAATVLSSMRSAGPGPTRCARTRRRIRSDTTTVARFTHADPAAAAAQLRLTDEVAADGTTVTAVLRGCDDVEALATLERIGAEDIEARPADRHEPRRAGRHDRTPGGLTAGMMGP